MLKCSFRTRLRRASCTVWIVALLPEPWKARMVGLTGSAGWDIFAGGVLRVRCCWSFLRPCVCGVGMWFELRVMQLSLVTLLFPFLLIYSLVF